jgi:hypothetical protein
VAHRRLALWLRRTLPAALAVAAAGCMVGPDYVRPETPEPVAWSAPLEHGLERRHRVTRSCSRAGGRRSAIPLLTDLMERAVRTTSTSSQPKRAFARRAGRRVVGTRRVCFRPVNVGASGE